MVQKQKLRPSPLDEPPTASSSDSEEEEEEQPSSKQPQEVISSGEDEEEASSGEEEEEDDDLPPPISKIPPTNPQPNPQPSSSESETESGSETESEPEPTPAKVKPLASKPMDQTQKPKAQPSPALPKSAPKRAPDSNNTRATDPKRAKNKGTVSSSTATASDDEMEEEGKKSGDQSKKFQRLWSEEDEVAILKGLVEFTSKTGQDPLKFSNVNAFHDFMKKLLHVEVSSNQLKEKVRRLKKKFETHAVREKSGDGPKFFKPHDQKAFELSKKVWGTEDGRGLNGSLEKPKANGNAAKSPKKKETATRSVASAKKSKPETKPVLVPVPAASLELKEPEKMQIDQNPDSGDTGLFLREMARFKEGTSVYGLDEDDMKRGLEMIGESKRAELREKWKKLHHAEIQLFANRSELIGEQTKLIVEALRSSNH